mgnify:CR=1 FL=1
MATKAELEVDVEYLKGQLSEKEGELATANEQITERDSPIEDMHQQIIDANRFQYPTGTLWIYGTIFFMYFIVCWPLSIVARRLEKRWKHD